ncbi:MAG: rane protein, partial [Pseudonocardia sp.]|nr:rane protein [Pseudonocardia sp.]
QLRRLAAADGPLAGELTRLAGAWALAERHGVALAELLDAVRRDVDARVRHGRRLRAQLAGARATTMVLTVLPVLGVVLGQGVGAQPWSVLTATSGGQVLLVIGVALACLGMLWSDQITARAARQ